MQAECNEWDEVLTKHWSEKPKKSGHFVARKISNQLGMWNVLNWLTIQPKHRASDNMVNVTKGNWLWVSVQQWRALTLDYKH